MSIYSLKDFEVTIYFTHPHLGDMSCSFDVLSYTKEEAEDQAYSEWSNLGYESVGVLNYHTQEV
ncbi:hypothetical protein [Photobacterium damselae]|uniref:hypothetical protein n=1 Tax=Photobacterium damselae TaxID=38293 RepID=UPI004068E10E